MGKGKKRGQIEKISASEASRAVACGGEKGAALSPSQNTSRLTSPATFFFFAHADFFHLFSPNAEPGPRLPLNKPLDSRLWLNLTSRLSKESCRRIEQNKFILSGAVF